MPDSQERINILGVGVDPVTVEELHPKIKRYVEEYEHALVLNANAHCLNLAYEDGSLRDFLNGAEVVFCDGAGVVLAARVLGGHIPVRITYADWIWQLASFAAEEEFSLYFLGARPGIAEKAASKLIERYPKLKISGVHHGYFDQTVGSPQNNEIVRQINAAGADILVVGFGMPLQERWLMQNWKDINANVALTGGAVFDYVSGELRRGPRILVDNGFEWLARFLIEPARLWRRYLVGNPLFLWRVILQRLRSTL